MAGNLKDTDKPGKDHNHGPLSDEDKMDLIRKLDEELIPLEKIKADANDKMKALRRDFKKKTAIVQADFNAGRRLAQIEDPDEQKDKTGKLELCFNALSQNSQLSFFDQAEEKKK